MSTHPKQIELEAVLRRLCDDLDHYLEDTYGDRYPLHPNRPARGTAASVAYDGLFSTGTQFTLGYGSDHGRGYLVSVEIRTLSTVRQEDRERLKDLHRISAIDHPHLFSRSGIEAETDGNVYKLVGDFSLGNSSN